MFGLDQIQHADAFLKQAAGNQISFARDPEGKATCLIHGASVAALGKGESLQDALKDALAKAGIKA